MGFNRYYNEKSNGCVLTQTPCWKFGSVCSDCDVPYQVHGHRDESIPLKYKYNRVDTMNHVCDYRKETWVHPRSNIKTCKYTCVICGNTYSENIPTNYDTWTRTEGSVSNGGYIEAGRAKITAYNVAIVDSLIEMGILEEVSKTENEKYICPIKCEICYDNKNCVECTDPKITLIREHTQRDIDNGRRVVEESIRINNMKLDVSKNSETFWQKVKKYIFG